MPPYGAPAPPPYSPPRRSPYPPPAPHDQDDRADPEQDEQGAGGDQDHRESATAIAAGGVGVGQRRDRDVVARRCHDRYRGRLARRGGGGGLHLQRREGVRLAGLDGGAGRDVLVPGLLR